MPASYPTLTVVKEILQQRGLAPHKRLGQNFLIDANIARKSLDLAKVVPGDVIVEIGPGLGALTQLLLDAGCQVYAIEKDAGLYEYLKETLEKKYPDSLHLMFGDALEFPFGSLENPPRETKIVANLPYAISTPWLDAVLSGDLAERLVLMLQTETANRFIAKAGTGNYGPISIFLNSAYHVVDQHRVGPQCFYPKPDVGSTLLSLRRKEMPVIFPGYCKEGIRQLFRQRRKQIISVISKADLADNFNAWVKTLIEEGLPQTTRPETIPVEQWQRLITR